MAAGPTSASSTSPPQTPQHGGDTAAARATLRAGFLRRGACGLNAAFRFLLPLGRRLEDRPEMVRDAPLAVGWIVPLGLLTGLLWAGVFRGCWRIFGETGNLRVVPALSVVLLECLFTGAFLALGLARTVHLLTGAGSLRAVSAAGAAPLSPVGTLVLCLTILAQWVLVVSIPHVTPWWPSPDNWRYHFNFMYPRPIYRPLVLAPLWGRWGILLAATIGRTAADADAATVAVCRAMTPMRLLRQAALPLVLTAIYCSRSRNFLTGVIIGLLVFGFSFSVAVAMARRAGGQTGQTLFATGQVAQLSLLALYRAFWPLIHE